MFISTAYAQDGAGAAGGGLLEMFLPLILIFAIFYFLLIRPQQKRQKEHQAKLASARRGDKVVLGGGIMGQVTKVIDEGELMVKIADEVEVKVLKSTLLDVLSKTEPAKGPAPTPTPANEGAEPKKSILGSLFGKK